MKHTVVTAIVDPRRTGSGQWLLKVRCPFCGRVHFFLGGSGSQPVGGSRRAPCAGGEDYTLVLGRDRFRKGG